MSPLLCLWAPARDVETTWQRPRSPSLFVQSVQGMRGCWGREGLRAGRVSWRNASQDKEHWLVNTVDSWCSQSAAYSAEVHQLSVGEMCQWWKVPVFVWSPVLKRLETLTWRQIWQIDNRVWSLTLWVTHMTPPPRRLSHLVTLQWSSVLGYTERWGLRVGDAAKRQEPLRFKYTQQCS